MKPREIHHIGHAVEDIADAVATYERLFGAVAEHHETVPEQGVEAVSLRVGADRIELLRPLGEETPVGRFMASRGPGMHHVAFSVDGTPVDLSKTFNYKGMMYSDVPNLASSFGYTNASWTLKADLTAEYICRLLNHMQAGGHRICVPRVTDPAVTDLFAFGYDDIAIEGYEPHAAIKAPVAV